MSNALRYCFSVLLVSFIVFMLIFNTTRALETPLQPFDRHYSVTPEAERSEASRIQDIQIREMARTATEAPNAPSRLVIAILPVDFTKANLSSRLPTTAEIQYDLVDSPQSYTKFISLMSIGTRKLDHTILPTITLNYDVTATSSIANCNSLEDRYVKEAIQKSGLNGNMGDIQKIFVIHRYMQGCGPAAAYIDGRHAWMNYGASPTFTMSRMMTHEIGHTFGLKHATTHADPPQSGIGYLDATDPMGNSASTGRYSVYNQAKMFAGTVSTADWSNAGDGGVVFLRPAGTSTPPTRLEYKSSGDGVISKTNVEYRVPNKQGIVNDQSGIMFRRVGLEVQYRNGQPANTSVYQTPSGGFYFKPGDALPVSILGYSAKIMSMNGKEAAICYTANISPTMNSCDKVVKINSIVNAADYGIGVVSGGSAAIFGRYLIGESAGCTLTGSAATPNTLCGSTITVGGKQAVITYAASTQVNFIIPTGVSGTVPVVISNPLGTHTYSLVLKPFSASLFTQNSQGTGLVKAMHWGSSRYPNATLVAEAKPLRRGEYVVMYGNGLGASAGQLSRITLKVNGAILPSDSVQYAASAPGLPGADQINVKLPATMSISNTVSQSTQLCIDGVCGNVTTLPIVN